MSDLLTEIEAYEALRVGLEVSSMGKWVVVKDQKVFDTYDTFEQAAEHAVEQFGRGPYLIRQIGASPVTIPASLMFRIA